MRLIMAGLVTAAMVMTASAADCPEPANGKFYSVAEFNSASTGLLICCCLQNELSPWNWGAMSDAASGCECYEQLESGWDCSQRKKLGLRSVTAQALDNHRHPPPPSGGWGNSLASTYQLQVFCNCIDKGQTPWYYWDDSCTIYGGQVPYRNDPCVACP